jgi:hypothetical protein
VLLCSNVCRAWRLGGCRYLCEALRELNGFCTHTHAAPTGAARCYGRPERGCVQHHGSAAAAERKIPVAWVGLQTNE